MDYAPDSGNVVHVIPEPWASEEEYRVWNAVDSPSDTPSNSNHDQRRSGSEPPSKKSKGAALDSASSANSRAKAIGKMFFKTKLCCKFRAGTCPYVTNCNFAHSVDELRRPPPNWQEIVSAANDEEREEFQIPSVGSAENPQRSYKGRHCKKFYTEEGCPYGDTCTFLHDEQSKNRESVAISLGPGGYSSGGGSNSGAGAGASAGANANANANAGAAGTGAAPGSSIKPSNWKTRICNKWELTGYCPFGSKCHFAHGSAELHRYGGGLLEQEARDGGSVPSDPKQGGGGGGGGAPPKAPTDNVVATANSAPHLDVYHTTGVPVQSQRTGIILQRPGQRVHQKWKGPDKISRIYGDWIDDIE